MKTTIKWERPKIICEICLKKYSPSIYAKWHGVHCAKTAINMIRYNLK